MDRHSLEQLRAKKHAIYRIDGSDPLRTTGSRKNIFPMKLFRPWYFSQTIIALLSPHLRHLFALPTTSILGQVLNQVKYQKFL